MADAPTQDAPAPSRVITSREVKVVISFLVPGMDQQTAEQWALAGITVGLAQASTIRGVAVASEAAKSDLVVVPGGGPRRM